jgi:Cu(I)/Ag(I) efflux system membrane protein CusA/SilA
LGPFVGRDSVLPVSERYLRSLNDLEVVPVATKNGTPVLVRDLGTVTFGPDIREGVAEWQGEGETVAGIVVMRDGMNALAVIDGIKKKLAEIKSSLPAGVEVVSGYDRSALLSIERLVAICAGGTRLTLGLLLA